MSKDITKTLEELNSELDAAKNAYRERAKELLNQSFKEFFDANPTVRVFGWRQYTPYFNDGDPCEFQCQLECSFASNAEDYTNIQYGEYEGESESVWIDDGDYGSFNEELIPEDTLGNIQDLRETLMKINEDIFLEVFGDHVTVYATRDGFDVQEYDHD